MEFADPSLCLFEHRLGDVGTENADVRRVLRQRNAGADTDFEHAAADPIGGGNGCPPALAEYAAEHEVVDRGPAVVGVFDRGTVEVQLACVVKFHGFGHRHSHWFVVAQISFYAALWPARRGIARSEWLGCSAVRLPMNCLALFSQERSSAKFRQAWRDMPAARRQA